MSHIRTRGQSYIRESRKSSLFLGSDTTGFLKLLDGAAEQYLKAKSRHYQAAQNLDRRRQEINRLMARMKAEFDIQD